MKNFISIFLLLLNSFFCQSQTLNLDSFSSKYQEFIIQIKQLNQFINHFNNKDLAYSNQTIKNDYERERKKSIISLFNFEDSTIFNDKTEEFINYVCNDSNYTHLDFNDDNWYANVNCSVKFKSKAQNINLILKKEGDSKVGFKWVISGVHAPFIDLKSQYSDTVVFIGPMNHELSFMGLFDVFNDYENISEYTFKEYEPDNLSIFLFLVKSKEIKYVRVNSIQYHFLQIPNWIFTVDYFNRPYTNSGWLISSVLNVNNLEKKEYKKNNLYLR